MGSLLVSGHEAMTVTRFVEVRATSGDPSGRWVGRWADRGQSGYVLGIVLAAMTVGLLIITALLSLSFATHRAALMQEELAREQRASDGALETALTRIRSAMNTPGATDLCAPLADPDPEVGVVAFGVDTPTPDDDIDVHVNCDEVLGGGEGGSGGNVELVGDDYSSVPGGLPWDTWNWSDALRSTPVPDSALSPTLVHNGDEPLLFNGNVTVRSGAAPLLDAGDATGAVEVSGSYLQGAEGHPGPGCGMLDLGSSLADSDLTRTAIADNDTTPQCDDSDTANNLTPTKNTDQPSETPRSAPACAGSLVTLEPGDYNAVATQALNENLFDGDCPNRVFHFKPGDYWFDVPTAGDALTFDDATSAFVFGTRVGSAPATAACDPTAAQGVRVVLSGRATIEHLAGNVSMCADGGTGQALVQSEISPNDIAISNPQTGRHHYYWAGSYWVDANDFANVGNVTADAEGNDSATAVVNCAGEVFNPWKSCLLSFTVDLNAQGDAPVDNLRVAWTSSETPPAHVTQRGVRAILTKGGSTLCNKYLTHAGRTPGFISSVDLTGCVTSQSQLDGAKLRLEFDYRYPYAPVGDSPHIGLSVRGLDLMTNTHTVEATSASSPAAGEWATPAGSLAAGGAIAVHPELDCAGGVCTRDSDTQPNRLVLSDFDVASSGLEDDDQIQNVWLAIDNSGGDDAVAGPIDVGVLLGHTDIHVEWDDGNGGTESCDVPTGNLHTYTRSRNTYFIDILTGNACAALRQDASVLATATVTLSISAEKGIWIGSDLSPGIGLQLPALDHVRLVATSETTDEVHRGRVTSNLGDGVPTQFRVHGDVVMPRTSLDVFWTGPVDVQPIVDGSLELHSLGSIDQGGSVGVVCCGPGSRVARVVAEIQDDGGNWVPRGVARATMLRNSSAPLADMVVTGWQLCGGAGCDVPTGGVLGPPP